MGLSQDIDLRFNYGSEFALADLMGSVEKHLLAGFHTPQYLYPWEFYEDPDIVKIVKRQKCAVPLAEPLPDEHFWPSEWLTRSARPAFRSERIMQLWEERVLTRGYTGFTAYLLGNTRLTYLREGRNHEGDVFRWVCPFLPGPDYSVAPIGDPLWKLGVEEQPGRTWWESCLRIYLSPCYYERRHGRREPVSKPANARFEAYMSLNLQSPAWVPIPMKYVYKHPAFPDSCVESNWLRLLEVLDRLARNVDQLESIEAELQGIKHWLKERGLLDLIRDVPKMRLYAS